jgi:hypothetical protein
MQVQNSILELLFSATAIYISVWWLSSSVQICIGQHKVRLKVIICLQKCPCVAMGHYLFALTLESSPFVGVPNSGTRWVDDNFEASIDTHNS